MGQLQFVYSSTSIDSMSAAKAFDYARKNLGICKSLGLTGRVFADGKDALVIIEGEEDIMREYYAMVEADKYVLSFILHVERKIEEREFSDYQVVLGLPLDHEFCEEIRPLTSEEIDLHITPKLSSKLRLVASSILGPVVKLLDHRVAKIA